MMLLIERLIKRGNKWQERLESDKYTKGEREIIKEVLNDIDTDTQHGFKQRHQLAEAHKFMGIYVGVQKMEKETQALIKKDLDHCLVSHPTEEQF